MSSYRDGQKGGPVLLSNSQTVPGLFFLQPMDHSFSHLCTLEGGNRHGLYRIHAAQRGVQKMHIFNMFQLHHTLSETSGHQFLCFLPLKKPYYVGFQEAKGF